MNTLVDNSLDAGVNFIDTANVYAAGESETLLGKRWARSAKMWWWRSKVFGRMGPGANQVGLSRLHIMREAEASLQRLNTDYIDLYQIHGFDSLTPLEETLGALTDLVRQGKVRYIGCSNLAAWQIMKSLRDLRARPSGEIHHAAGLLFAGRARTGARNRSHADGSEDGTAGLEPSRRRLSHGQVHARRSHATTTRAAAIRFPAGEPGEGLRHCRCHGAVGKRRNATVAQIALAWLLHQPSVTSVIIGAKKQTQLKDNLASVDVKLDDADLKEIDAVSRLTPEYPGWMMQGDDRRPGQVRDWSKFLSPPK